jgi:hypothetical protein
MARLPTIGPKPRSGDKKKRLDLEELYAELPALECKGLCAESCGPISMSRVEWQRVCRARGAELKASSLMCPLLEHECCSVYEVRPMLCRLWGLVESMKCPWGCVPERYLTDVEGYEFMERAAEIGS